VVVARAATPPRIDALLEDEAWQGRALSLGEWLTDNPLNGEKLAQTTEVRAVYDDRSIYFAFRCRDPQPGKVRSTLSRRDRLWNDDWVGLSLDSVGNGQSSYDFFVKPAGVQADRRLERGLPDLAAGPLLQGVPHPPLLRRGLGRAAPAARARLTPRASTCQCVEVRGVRMVEARAELPQGTLDLLILEVVALGPLHGYAIAQRLQQISRDVVRVQQGSLYPALHRLENRGLLAAEWKASDTGREAKFYRLTARGRTRLGEEEEEWRRLSEAVGLILAARGRGA
jgi:transcriptional regulator